MVFSVSKYPCRYKHPLPTFSSLAFSVAVSSALRIGLASPVLSVLPIGTRSYRIGSHSNPCTHDSIATCQVAVLRTSLSRSRKRSVLPCRCQGNCQTVYSLPIGFPPLRDWKRSYDIILRCQSWILWIVLHSDGKEREVIHKALE